MYILPIAQIHQNFMYIETIQVIKINEIIADTNFIHAAYRMAKFNVKHCTLKIGSGK